MFCLFNIMNSQSSWISVKVFNHCQLRLFRTVDESPWPLATNSPITNTFVRLSVLLRTKQYHIPSLRHLSLASDDRRDIVSPPSLVRALSSITSMEFPPYAFQNADCTMMCSPRCPRYVLVIVRSKVLTQPFAFC